MCANIFPMCPLSHPRFGAINRPPPMPGPATFIFICIAYTSLLSSQQKQCVKAPRYTRFLVYTYYRYNALLVFPFILFSGAFCFGIFLFRSRENVNRLFSLLAFLHYNGTWISFDAFNEQIELTRAIRLPFLPVSSLARRWTRPLVQRATLFWWMCAEYQSWTRKKDSQKNWWPVINEAVPRKRE